MISVSAGAVLCLCMGATLAQPAARLAWPPELPNPALPGASLYVSDKSNVVLDFHGSVQDPDLVIFMAGNQYPVFPDLIAAFRDWLATQPAHRGVKAERIFYATTPPGRLIDAMQSGQLLLGNFWLEVRADKLCPVAFHTGPRTVQVLRGATEITSWAEYT